MATRLQLYNRALRIIQERKLSSLTEKREPRFLLDDVWEEGGVRLLPYRRDAIAHRDSRGFDARRGP